MSANTFYDLAKIPNVPNGSVADIAAANKVTLLVLNNGDVYALGLNSNCFFGNASNTNMQAFTTTPVQASISDVATIETTQNAVVALLKNGTVWSWGNNINVSQTSKITHF
jgi:alpha-tubulin suppressor-like RCC1 family protein